MSIYNTQAIVLANRPFGEADRIVTLFTLARGKVRAVAKGARRPRNRLAGLTQLFTHADLQLFAGKNMDTISQGQIINPFRVLREDLDRMAYGVYVLELFERATEGISEYQDYFVLLLTALELCQHGSGLSVARHGIEARLLSLMGYRPVLDRCVACGRPLEAATALRYSADDGGVLCDTCHGYKPDLVTVSRGTLAALDHLLRTDPRRLAQFKPDAQQLRELDELLTASLSQVLGGPVKSSAFLLDLARLS